MAYVSLACETAEELLETLIKDVLHATCSPQEKLQAATRLVRFCTHPEQSLLLEGLDESEIPGPDPEPEPEQQPPEPIGLARRFGLRAAPGR